MAGRHRSMGGEYAFFAHRLNIGSIAHYSPGAPRLFIQQFQGKQTRMAFVHVISLDVFMSQGTEHPHAAHAEHHFLHQPIMLIAAIEKMGQRPIRWAVVREIGIEKVNRDAETAGADHLVLPRPQHHRSTFDRHAGSLRQLSQKIIHRPIDRLFDLSAIVVKPLIEVAFTVE